MSLDRWFLLQAIGCYCYWDMHSIKLTEHVHAGRQNCVCTECTVAWVASSSPAIGGRAGVGRGFEDGLWAVVDLRTGSIGGLVVGPISSLQLWRRNKLIWQWQMNHLLFPQLPVLFLSNSFPTLSLLSIPPPFAFWAPSTLLLSSSFSPTKLFFSLGFLVLNFLLYLCSFFLWCSFILCHLLLLTFILLFLCSLAWVVWRLLHLKRSCYSLLCSHF